MGNMHPIFLVSFLVVQLLWLPIGSIGQPQGGAVPVTRLQLPLGASFPDTTAFNQAGRGPFTGISDGRILEYVNSSVGYVEFAIASPKRPKIICNGSITNPILQPICGRPLGLAFNHRTGQLFVVDTALGLAVVSPDGGNGTLLVTSAGGVGFKFLNGVDIDQDSEVVYFTDTSSKFTLSDIIKVLLTRDKTGRLLSYNPRTNESRVLLTGLAGPNGVAVSRDGSFLLFTEMVTNTIRRFWVTGPKANTTELFAQVEGLPDNIRINARGEVWVATTVNALLPTAVPVGLKFSEEGVLQQNTTFDIKFGSSLLLSDVNTFEGKFYLGLTTQTFLGRANISNSF
ncbi:protein STRICTOSIDINE SYNTHASE-LIKE 12-like [Punica granatum]|uniref:Protein STRICTOSIDINE SYNTHASE-LIKE 12-like n=1 Tax=Punica granatum TaxID=22663 RepID=A0A6P8BQ28_PUNGR|nr:protein STRICTOSIDINE SYNTHASE-LIKE 12-like [Punica granatum]